MDAENSKAAENSEKNNIGAETSETEKSLNKFSVNLIKAIGIVGAVVGSAILIAFWYWLFSLLFK